MAAGVLDDGSRTAAEALGSRFGCWFQYDADMREWRFIRPAMRQ
jgi:hypothetical protein